MKHDYDGFVVPKNKKKKKAGQVKRPKRSTRSKKKVSSIMTKRELGSDFAIFLPFAHSSTLTPFKLAVDP